MKVTVFYDFFRTELELNFQILLATFFEKNLAAVIKDDLQKSIFYQTILLNFLMELLLSFICST